VKKTVVAKERGGTSTRVAAKSIRTLLDSIGLIHLTMYGVVSLVYVVRILVAVKIRATIRI
jgi:hypothetical protein